MADTTSDALLREILHRTRVIAIVGVSTNPVRASHFVARYLKMRNYRIVPVNPAYAGQTLLGEKVIGSLAEAPETVDMVDIFRRPDAVPGIVDEAMAHLPKLKTIWMQFDITHPEAAAKAQAAGLDVVQDRCPKIEYQRLSGELRRAGINTGLISSKLPNWRH